MFTGGTGTVHGIDISNRSFNMASRNLKQEIATGKVTLHMASVTDIPFDASTFDSIFHTNCYYFWPDMDAAAKELHRVIKPEKLMVACLNHSRLKDLAEKGFMQCGNIDPDRYMSALEKNGFYDVNMKSVSFENKDVDAIVAKVRKEVT
jgi:ubiquinone/menaquinone biosynthesis C-methylase UbiE